VHDRGAQSVLLTHQSECGIDGGVPRGDTIARFCFGVNQNGHDGLICAEEGTKKTKEKKKICLTTTDGIMGPDFPSDGDNT
jgi:hypothetical protein